MVLTSNRRAAGNHVEACDSRPRSCNTFSLLNISEYIIVATHLTPVTTIYSE